MPPQYPFDPRKEPRVVGMATRMEEPNADIYLVSGILPDAPGSRWRWANPKAELRFQFLQAAAATFFIDLVLADSVFRETGPVEFTFRLEGREFARTRLDRPGGHHFEAPVEAGWVNAALPSTLTIEADRYFTAPTDGVKLAFLLVAAGFRQ